MIQPGCGEVDMQGGQNAPSHTETVTSKQDIQNRPDEMRRTITQLQKTKQRCNNRSKIQLLIVGSP